MDEKNYYEKSPVSSANEIKAAYNYAVEHNIKYYRTVSRTGVIYGWDGTRHVRAQGGQEWFENPEYKEPEPEPEIIEAEEVEEAPEEIEEIEIPQDAVVNDVTVKELKEEIEKLRKENATIAETCRQTMMERDNIQREYAEYKNTIEKVREFFRG